MLRIFVTLWYQLANPGLETHSPGRDFTQTVGRGWSRGWAPVHKSTENLSSSSHGHAHPQGNALLYGACRARSPQGTCVSFHAIPKSPRWLTCPLSDGRNLLISLEKGALFVKIFAELLSFLWSVFLHWASPAPELVRSGNASTFFLPLPCWSHSRNVKTLFLSKG